VLLLIGEVLPGFQQICTIEIDLLRMRLALQKKKRPSRTCFEPALFYWALQYSIAFVFGSTELKAFIIWKENVRMYNVYFTSPR
jgi:hypothetical protein